MQLLFDIIFPLQLGVRENQNLKFQNQLDNSPTSYSVVLSFAPGSYKYMCTRNNNFSNRNQKASITVSQGAMNSPTPATTTRATTRPTTKPTPVRRRIVRRRRIRRTRRRTG